MVCLDLEPFIPHHWFESLDTLYGLASIVEILRKIEDLVTCTVHKQAAARVSNTFHSKCMREMTLSRREIVVSGNTITRSKMISLECVIIQQRASGHVGWRSSGSLSKTTCRTFCIWNIKGRSAAVRDNKLSQVKCGVRITSVGKPFPTLHKCLDPICWGTQQSLVLQENFLLRRGNVAILLMEDRLDHSYFFVFLDRVTKSIRPKTISSTRWKGKGNHGEVSARVVVHIKIHAIVQNDVHSLISEKSMTT